MLDLPDLDPVRSMRTAAPEHVEIPTNPRWYVVRCPECEASGPPQLPGVAASAAINALESTNRYGPLWPADINVLDEAHRYPGQWSFFRHKWGLRNVVLDRDGRHITSNAPITCGPSLRRGANTARRLGAH